MQVKTFSGNSSQAVLARIKAELGPDAVILDTRHYKEDGRSVVRISAGLDRDDKTAEPGGEAAGQGPPPGWQRWHEEWSSIKGHLLAMLKPGLKLESLSPKQRLALEYLEREGADDEVILRLYSALAKDPGLSILAALSGLVGVKPWGARSWPQKTHFIAGPYGVGKTTAAVRLALNLQRANPGLRICLLNADAARGNGRILLKHYAELSDLLYREVSGPADLAAVLADLADKEVEKIIVDLPGLPRGGNLSGLLAELGFEAGGKDAAMHLVLLPHYAQSELLRLMARYHCGLDSGIIWSKLDEAERYGAILNIARASGLPVSALSYGPGLRDTLIPARETLLWRLIFKRELPGQDEIRESDRLARAV